MLFGLVCLLLDLLRCRFCDDVLVTSCIHGRQRHGMDYARLLPLYNKATILQTSTLCR